MSLTPHNLANSVPGNQRANSAASRSTEQNSRWSYFWIWLAATIFLMITWWHIYSLLTESRNKVIASAERDLANLTRVSQEHADRTFRAADQVIRFIQSRYLALGKGLDLTQLSEQGVIDTEIFPQIGIIDAKGIYALANRPITGKLDLSDREHFKYHLTKNSDELFVSKPVLGRATGKWSIQLTRRISKANGEFAGVVVVSIDPGYFTRFYNEIKLGSQGVVALYGLDGIARASKVGDKEEFGTDARQSPIFNWMQRGQLEGTYTQVSALDGVERMYHFRKLPRYNLAVVDGIDTPSLLSNYEHEKQALWLQAAFLSLLIVALATALTRYLLQIRFQMNERQIAQGRAEDRSEQLNAIFALSPDGFVSFDDAHCVKYASPAFHHLTGLARSSILGRTEAEFSNLIANICLPNAQFLSIADLRTRQRATDDNTPLIRQVIELKGENKRTLEVGLRESQAESISQILYFRDITHETEVDRMKSEFLSTAAHELRTPMASIYGFSEIMLSQEFSEAERREFFATIFKQSERMVAIINELLDLARIEARRGKDFNFAELNLQDLLTETLDCFMPPLARSAPKTDFLLPPIYIRADADKMMQVFTNVLTNAYKYSPNGEDVRLEIIQPDLREAAPYVGIRISDQGMGMTETQVTRIFERFYRADSSGKIPGSGLGMSIVHEIMEIHAGKVSVESQIEHGTSVTLFLPVQTQHKST